MEYTGGVGVAKFSNHGSSNFIVMEYDPASGSQGNIDANEIGTWSGTGTLSGGPVVLDVESDGTWSIQCC